MLLAPLQPTGALQMMAFESTGEEEAAEAAAIDLYGTDDVEVQRADGEYFRAAFPDHTLYSVEDNALGFAVEHSFALTPDGSAARDVTRRYQALLEDVKADRGVLTLITSSALAKTYALAYVEAAQVEYQQTRQVLYANMSTAFGTPIQDPAAATTLTGWRATATTWDRVNGVMQDWTILFDLNTITKATWDVRKTSVGQYEPDLHGLLFQVGHYAVADYAYGDVRLAVYYRDANGNSQPVDDIATIRTPEINALSAGAAQAQAAGEVDTVGPVIATGDPQFDGSHWVVRSPVNSTATYALALASLAAAEYVYERQVEKNTYKNCLTGEATPAVVNPGDDWGFDSRDPDCILEIQFHAPLALRGCGTAGEPTSTDPVKPAMPTVIMIHSDIRKCLQLAQVGLYAQHSDEELMRVVIGHEHFHSLQFIRTFDLATNQDWAAQKIKWEVWTEGTAVWSVTHLDPENEIGSDTFWRLYGSKYMERTSHGLCDHNPYSDRIGLGQGSAVESEADYRRWFYDWIDNPNPELPRA
jgi:hypothetical protein